MKNGDRKHISGEYTLHAGFCVPGTRGNELDAVRGASADISVK
jgi:hypothetical protein